MRDDGERTSAYAAAIAATAHGRVCLVRCSAKESCTEDSERDMLAAAGVILLTVLLALVPQDVGTGALALLALLAARAGAKHVYAIEANPDAAAAARALVAAEGFADVVTIVEGYSTDVTLPEKVDLLLHEIIGEVLPRQFKLVAITTQLLNRCLFESRLPTTLTSPTPTPTPKHTHARTRSLAQRASSSRLPTPQLGTGNRHHQLQQRTQVARRPRLVRWATSRGDSRCSPCRRAPSLSSHPQSSRRPNTLRRFRFRCSPLRGQVFSSSPACRAPHCSPRPLHSRISTSRGWSRPPRRSTTSAL